MLGGIERPVAPSTAPAGASPLPCRAAGPNLLQHMLMRHQFDYDETADFGRTEDDVMAEVLRQSLIER